MLPPSLADRGTARSDGAVRVAAYTDSNDLGGAEKALATLVRGLGDWIDVTVVGTDPAIVREVAAGRDRAETRIVRSVRSKWDLRGSVAHLRMMRELRPDVLHANLPTPWSCQYALSAALLTPGVRTLAVHHAIALPETQAQLRLNRLNLKRLDAHVAVSVASAAFVERVVGLGEGAVRVIYNGVPDVPVTAAPRVADGPVVGYVGRLAPEKGLDVLLRAIGSLPDVTTVLVGDGPDRPRLERLGRQLGVSDRICMPGWVKDPRPWYPGFDVLALPSRSEALGIAAIEAMLARLPVVASRVGGTPEVVVDGDTGILVPPDDHEALARGIRSLLAAPALRSKMGESGREIALRRFGLPPMLRSYESIYRELLGPERPSDRESG